MSDILEKIYNIYYLYNKKAGDSDHDRKWKKETREQTLVF